MPPPGPSQAGFRALSGHPLLRVGAVHNGGLNNPPHRNHPLPKWAYEGAGATRGVVGFSPLCVLCCRPTLRVECFRHQTPISKPDAMLPPRSKTDLLDDPPGDMSLLPRCSTLLLLSDDDLEATWVDNLGAPAAPVSPGGPAGFAAPAVTPSAIHGAYDKHGASTGFDDVTIATVSTVTTNCHSPISDHRVDPDLPRRKAEGGLEVTFFSCETG